MPIILLETRVTITLNHSEAWGLHNALGNMSESLWKKAGVAPEDQLVAEDLFRKLEDHLNPPQREGKENA